jgi:hypothetical protein
MGRRRRRPLSAAEKAELNGRGEAHGDDRFTAVALIQKSPKQTLGD